MRTILPEVDDAILEAIRQNFTLVPKGAIVIRRSDTPPKKMPAVYLWNRAFAASDISIGASGPEIGEIVEVQFDGDGKKRDFKLPSLPLRPLIEVEYPPRQRIQEGRDFKVDYSSGTMRVLQPPEQGRKNLSIRYFSGKDAAEIKGLKLRLIYDLDVWSSEPAEQSSLVNGVASAILKTRELLASKGIQIRLTRGRDLTAKDAIPEGIFCKRLECVAETDMLVKLPIPRIEKIDLKRVPETVSR